MPAVIVVISMPCKQFIGCTVVGTLIRLPFALTLFELIPGIIDGRCSCLRSTLLLMLGVAIVGHIKLTDLDGIFCVVRKLPCKEWVWLFNCRCLALSFIGITGHLFDAFLNWYSVGSQNPPKSKFIYVVTYLRIRPICRSDVRFSYFFLFLGFLASVGMKYENLSSPFCEITFQKRNTQIGQIRKSVTTYIDSKSKSS